MPKGNNTGKWQIKHMGYKKGMIKIEQKGEQR